MFLLDTNIILEYLLDQDKSDEVEKFFKRYSPDAMSPVRIFPLLAGDYLFLQGKITHFLLSSTIQ